MVRYNSIADFKAAIELLITDDEHSTTAADVRDAFRDVADTFTLSGSDFTPDNTGTENQILSKTATGYEWIDPYSYTLTDSAVLDLASNARSSADLNKLLAVSSTNINSLVLVSPPVAFAPDNTGTENQILSKTATGYQWSDPYSYTLTDDAVLDLALSTRTADDRGKLLSVSATNENDLAIITPPVSFAPSNTGTVNQILTKTDAGYHWADAPSDFSPASTGTTGQILTKTASGYDWADAPSDFSPESTGTTGQILTKTDSGYNWSDAPSDFSPQNAGTVNQILSKNADGTYSWKDAASTSYTLTDDAVLDLIAGSRTDADRGKLLGISATDENALAFYASTGNTINAGTVLDLAQAARDADDRSKLLAVGADDENTLALLNAPISFAPTNEGTTNQILTKTASGYHWADPYTLTDNAILDLITSARTADDRSKLLGISSSDEDALALYAAPVSFAPSNAGATNQLLTKTSDGYEWRDGFSLTSEKVLDLAQSPRTVDDRGKLLGVSTSNFNAMILVDRPVAFAPTNEGTTGQILTKTPAGYNWADGYELTADAVLDLISNTRPDSDLGKLIGISETDRDALAFYSPSTAGTIWKVGAQVADFNATVDTYTRNTKRGVETEVNNTGEWYGITLDANTKINIGGGDYTSSFTTNQAVVVRIDNTYDAGILVGDATYHTASNPAQEWTSIELQGLLFGAAANSLLGGSVLTVHAAELAPASAVSFTYAHNTVYDATVPTLSVDSYYQLVTADSRDAPTSLDQGSIIKVTSAIVTNGAVTILYTHEAGEVYDAQSDLSDYVLIYELDKVTVDDSGDVLQTGSISYLGMSNYFEPDNEGTLAQILTKTEDGYEWADIDASSVLDQVSVIRTEADRTKLIGISATDENALQLYQNTNNILKPGTKVGEWISDDIVILTRTVNTQDNDLVNLDTEWAAYFNTSANRTYLYIGGGDYRVDFSQRSYTIVIGNVTYTNVPRVSIQYVNTFGRDYTVLGLTHNPFSLNINSYVTADNMTIRTGPTPPFTIESDNSLTYLTQDREGNAISSLVEGISYQLVTGDVISPPYNLDNSSIITVDSISTTLNVRTVTYTHEGGRTFTAQSDLDERTAIYNLATVEDSDVGAVLRLGSIYYLAPYSTSSTIGSLAFRNPPDDLTDAEIEAINVATKSRNRFRGVYDDEEIYKQGDIVIFALALPGQSSLNELFAVTNEDQANANEPSLSVSSGWRLLTEDSHFRGSPTTPEAYNAGDTVLLDDHVYFYTGTTGNIYGPEFIPLNSDVWHLIDPSDTQIGAIAFRNVPTDLSNTEKAALIEALGINNYNELINKPIIKIGNDSNLPAASSATRGHVYQTDAGHRWTGTVTVIAGSDRVVNFTLFPVDADTTAGTRYKGAVDHYSNLPTPVATHQGWWYMIRSAFNQGIAPFVQVDSNLNYQSIAHSPDSNHAYIGVWDSESSARASHEFTAADQLAAFPDADGDYYLYEVNDDFVAGTPDEEHDHWTRSDVTDHLLARIDNLETEIAALESGDSGNGESSGGLSVKRLGDKLGEWSTVGNIYVGTNNRSISDDNWVEGDFAVNKVTATWYNLYLPIPTSRLTIGVSYTILFNNSNYNLGPLTSSTYDADRNATRFNFETSVDTIPGPTFRLLEGPSLVVYSTNGTDPAPFNINSATELTYETTDADSNTVSELTVGEYYLIYTADTISDPSYTDDMIIKATAVSTSGTAVTVTFSYEGGEVYDAQDDLDDKVAIYPLRNLMPTDGVGAVRSLGTLVYAIT